MGILDSYVYFSATVTSLGKGNFKVDGGNSRQIKRCLRKHGIKATVWDTTDAVLVSVPSSQKARAIELVKKL